MNTRTKTWLVLGVLAGTCGLMGLRMWQRVGEIHSVESRLVQAQTQASAAVARRNAGQVNSASAPTSAAGASFGGAPSGNSVAAREASYREALAHRIEARPPPGSAPRLLPPTNMWIVIPDLMNDPQYAALQAVRQRWEIELRQTEMLDGIDWSEATRSRLAAVMVEFQAQMSDLAELTVAAGLDKDGTDRSVRNRLLSIRGAASMSMTAAIKEALGEPAYARYEKAARNSQIRTEIVDRLKTRLSYSSQPLTPWQLGHLTEQLGNLPRPRGIAPDLDTLSDEAIEQTHGILQAEQVEALRSLRAEWRTVNRMSEIVGQSVPHMN